MPYGAFHGTTVTSAQLPDEAKARAWRARFGGWILVADDGRAFWFDLSHTPTKVMLSPLARGISGKLI